VEGIITFFNSSLKILMKRGTDTDWHMVVIDPKNPEPREDLAPKCYGPY